MARQAQSGMGRNSKVTWILLAVPIVAVLMPTCVLLAVLMLPTMVAFVVDGSPGRKFVITVGMLNLAGSMPALVELWSQGQSFEAAFAGMYNVFSLASALMASGIGWLIYWIMPPIVARYQGVSSRTQVLALRARQKKLIADWGEEVAVVTAEPYVDGAEEAGDSDENAEPDAA